MPIKIKCACGKKLRIPDELAGKTGKCPACGRVIDVPGPAAEGKARRRKRRPDEPRIGLAIAVVVVVVILIIAGISMSVGKHYSLPGRLDRIEEKIEAGKVPEVYDELEQLAGKFPDNARVLHLFSLAQAQCGDFENAVETVKKAVKLDPRNPDMRYDLAMFYLELGKVAQARSVYQSLKELDPKLAEEVLSNIKIMSPPEEP